MQENSTFFCYISAYVGLDTIISSIEALRFLNSSQAVESLHTEVAA